MSEPDKGKNNGLLLPPFKAYDGDEPYIFAAYSPDDKHRVFPIIEGLNLKGYRIWYIGGSEQFENWQEKTEVVITKSAHVIVFISPALKADPHIQYEISYSIYQKKKVSLIYLEKMELPQNFPSLVGDKKNISEYQLKGNFDDIETKIELLSDFNRKYDIEPGSELYSKCRKKGYKIIEKLNESKRAVMFKAEDTKLNKRVALKIFKNEDSAIRKRYSEARLASFLSHPNIITTYDIGEIDGNFYISMEFVEGKDLFKVLLKYHPFPIPFILYTALEILKVFDYIHKKGIVHKNIKPSNIMLTKRQAIKIIGFGISIIHMKKENGILSGTPYYMSTEQIQGIELDHRSDIYSFGATLFHILTQRIPFNGDNVFYQHLFERTPSIKKFRGDVPAKLETIIGKCMEKKKEERYQDAREIISEIESMEIKPENRLF